MRRIVIILIAVVVIVLIIFFGWYFLLRNPDIPLGEVIRDVLPFGSGDNAQLTTDPSTSFDDAQDKSLGTDKLGVPTANLFRISIEPVAGVVVLNKNASTTVVRYVDRATGHIYDADLATLVKTKVTNQTLPKIYEAYFRPDGNAVLLRSLDDNSDMVENLSLALTPPRSTSTDTLYAVSSTALRGEIGAVIAGSGNTLFYTLEDTSSIVSSAFNGTGLKTLYTSPFTDWRLAVAGKNLVLFTKASASASGYAYTLNIANRALTKILGPLKGLTVNPNALGDQVLYSYVENDRTRLFTKNLRNNILSEFPITLAEKCVWSIKRATIFFCGMPTDDLGTGEPDDWYRGLTHFSDRIWLFDTNTDIAQVLAQPKQNLGIDIDLVEPKLSPNEDYLVFINKNDLSLWALRLE